MNWNFNEMRFLNIYILIYLFDYSIKVSKALKNFCPILKNTQKC